MHVTLFFVGGWQTLRFKMISKVMIVDYDSPLSINDQIDLYKFIAEM